MPELSIEVRAESPDHHQFLIKSTYSNTLPRIKVLATGGTIAAKGSSSSVTAGYQVDLTVKDLLESIPDISTICSLEYEQVTNLDSKEINSDHLMLLYKSITKELNTFDGFVITHGTDTLEETAFFLQSTLDSGEVPIVLSGSMRPSTAISADGPMNLYQAICIAASRASKNRGVLVSLNDQISSGYYITKANANTLDSFSNRQGYLGNFVNNEIIYYYPPTKPSGLRYFKLNTETELFPVHILYGHQGFDQRLVSLVVEQLGCKGLVFATCGAGSMPDETNALVKRIWNDYGVPVIYSKRSIDGMVPKAALDGLEGAIAGGYLNPQKCRILLQLCLNKGFNIAEIRETFAGVHGG